MPRRSVRVFVGGLALFSLPDVFLAGALVIPLRLQIIVFNRVRRMTSDCSLLIAAMRRSNELEIMEQVKTSSGSPQLAVCVLWYFPYVELLSCDVAKRLFTLLGAFVLPERFSACFFPSLFVATPNQ